MIDRLGPDSRALVDAARDGLGPDDVAVRRMRGRISVAVAGGAAVGGLAASAHAAAGAATTTTTVTASIAVKLAVVAVVAAGATVGTRAVIQHRATPPVAAPVIAQTRGYVVATIPTPPVPPPPAAIADPIVIDTPPPPPPPYVRHHTQVAVVAPVPEIAAPSLARETELLDLALADVSHSRFADAVAAIARYRDVTAGRGQLAEDADAIEIEALCRLDDAHSGAAFAAFTSHWPHAHEIDRLTAICRR